MTNPALTRYLTTNYAKRNDLSPEGLAKEAAACAREFGRFLPAERAAAILDVGCGAGAFLRCCADLGFTDLAGLDISPEQVEFCREQGLAHVECGDVVDFLVQTSRSFDFILLSDVLEHLPKDTILPVLEAARDRLTPAGRLILRVPNMSNPLNLRTRYVDFTHEVGFSQESLAQVLRVAELEIMEISTSHAQHMNWAARVLFDVVLWRLFRVFYRHVMHLKDDPLPGKNLLAVAQRRDST